MTYIDCAKVAAAIHADMCNDDSNGYSQSPRWGEDGQPVKTLTIDGLTYSYDRGSYDCSSSVITAWKEALKYTKYKGALDGATYTGNMRSVFEKSGLFYSSTASADRGDVYLNDLHHAALCQSQLVDGVYYYNGVKNKDMLSQFSINEYGGVTGGKVGDQTGKEAYIGAFYTYSRGWNPTLHYNGKANCDYNGASTSAKKSNDQVAEEVILGVWGNNPERAEKLKTAGYDPDVIQGIVNTKLKAPSTSNKMSAQQLADAIYAGKYGNEPERSKNLKALGYTDADIAAAQKIVNSYFNKTAETPKEEPKDTTPATTVTYPMRGIDVSSHDGEPFKAETEAAYKDAEFVIVKATQGVRYINPTYDYAVKRAIADNKCLGVYHYAEGGDPTAEAAYFVEKIKDVLGQAIPCLDWEGTQNPKFGDTEWCYLFAEAFYKLTGIYPMVYTSAAHISQLAKCADKCRLWVAGYPKNDNSWVVPDFKYDIKPFKAFTVWQFTSGGDIVDRNVANITAKEWTAIAAEGAAKKEEATAPDKGGCCDCCKCK